MEFLEYFYVALLIPVSLVFAISVTPYILGHAFRRYLEYTQTKDDATYWSNRVRSYKPHPQHHNRRAEDRRDV